MSIIRKPVISSASGRRISSHFGTACRFLLCIAIVAVLPLAAEAGDPESLEDGLYRYNSLSGDSSSFFIWEKADDGERVKIVVHDHENDRVMENICLKNGETVSWLVKDREREIRAERNVNALHVHGSEKGKPIDVSYTIDGRNWFQPLSFSLTGFLFSTEQTVSFWSVRQDTLEVLTMVAGKQGVENIEIDGAEVPAFKIEVRLEGFLSPFWHGTYWYRQTNGQFLQYRAVNGPPGTPETIITLAGRLSR